MIEFQWISQAGSMGYARPLHTVWIKQLGNQGKIQVISNWAQDVWGSCGGRRARYWQWNLVDIDWHSHPQIIFEMWNLGIDQVALEASDVPKPPSRFWKEMKTHTHTQHIGNCSMFFYKQTLTRTSRELDGKIRDEWPHHSCDTSWPPQTWWSLYTAARLVPLSVFKSLVSRIPALWQISTSDHRHEAGWKIREVRCMGMASFEHDKLFGLSILQQSQAPLHHYDPWKQS